MVASKALSVPARHSCKCKALQCDCSLHHQLSGFDAILWECLRSNTTVLRPHRKSVALKTPGLMCGPTLDSSNVTNIKHLSAGFIFHITVTLLQLTQDKKNTAVHSLGQLPEHASLRSNSGCSSPPRRSCILMLLLEQLHQESQRQAWPSLNGNKGMNSQNATCNSPAPSSGCSISSMFELMPLQPSAL
jgi:hypothetical protein